MSNSPNGFDVNCWGPALWASLSFIALNYPVNPTEKDQLTYSSFFRLLGPVLPCQKCSANYKAHASELDERHLRSRHTLIRWVFDVHNRVNESKKHPGRVLTTADMMEVVKMYETFRAGSGGAPARGLVMFVPKAKSNHTSTILMDKELKKKKNV